MLAFKGASVCDAGGFSCRLGRGDHGGRTVYAVDVAGALCNDSGHVYIEDAV
jgi:hypothetical protein